MRLIDADALIERVMGNGLKSITEQIFRKLINDAPTIDAVRVVRCKECKHWWSDGGAIMFCEQTDFPTDADDYCSYGEREGE